MLLAGILIGFGVILNLITKNPYIGSFLFSLGLLSIIKLKLQLFTGKVGFPNIPIRHKILILLMNLLGISILIFLYSIANKDFVLLLETAAELKFSKDFITLFIKGVLCGILIHIAVKAKDTPITILCVMAFILMGAEHCIADFPSLLVVDLNLINICKYLIIVVGNSLGAIATEELCGGD